MTDADLTPQQLADRWGLQPATLRGWRFRGQGPPYVLHPRIGLPRGTARVRYRLHDVLAFEAAHNITPIT